MSQEEQASGDQGWRVVRIDDKSTYIEAPETLGRTEGANEPLGLPKGSLLKKVHRDCHKQLV